MSPPNNNTNKNCPWTREFIQAQVKQSRPPIKPQKPIEQTILKYGLSILFPSKL